VKGHIKENGGIITCPKLKKLLAEKTKSESKDADKPKTEKSEAKINGEQYRTQDVAKSTGWAECGHKEINFTACLNGLIISGHLLVEGESHITFYHAVCAKEGLKIPVEKGKKIARDTLLFPRPPAWSAEDCPNLRTSSPVVGEKVKLIAYPDRAAALLGRPSDDSGVVKAVIALPNEERGFYNVSSVDGNCGAPACNASGKVVGWHNATTDRETVFIPCTALVVQLATSSPPSF
jgi:hypothetical protein